MGADVRSRMSVLSLFRPDLSESALLAGPEDAASRIRFTQTGNAFRRCSDPAALQEIADSLTAKDLLRCGHKWLKRLIPFFRPQERRAHGCWHQLFFAQVEYCRYVACNIIAVMCPRQICGVLVAEPSLMRQSARSGAHMRYEFA